LGVNVNWRRTLGRSYVLATEVAAPQGEMMFDN
jgi:hypothetical protein